MAVVFSIDCQEKPPITKTDPAPPRGHQMLVSVSIDQGPVGEPHRADHESHGLPGDFVFAEGRREMCGPAFLPQFHLTVTLASKTLVSGSKRCASNTTSSMRKV